MPVSDASAAVSFALYNESSSAIGGDACIWSNNSNTCASIVARTVTLTAGLFSEPLGDTAAGVPYAAIPATIFADDGTVYLQVVVNGETLVPRKQMLAAPYAMNSDVVDGYDTTTAGATSSMISVTDSNGNLVITGAPAGTGVNQGSMYINPASGAVASNEVLLGIAVSGVSKFSLDAEGDSTFAGNINATGAVSGSDFTCTDCLDYTELADSLALDATTSLNIGAFDYNFSGTGALGFGSTGQVTFAGNIDANSGIDISGANLTVGTDKIIVSPTSGNISTAGTGTANFGSTGQVTFAGNTDATNGLDVTVANFTVGGTNFTVIPGSGNVSTAGTGTANFASTGQVTFAGNVDATNGLDVTNADLTVGGSNFGVVFGTGNITTVGDIAVNGGDVTSTGLLKITSGGAGDITFDPASGLVSISTNKDLAVGGSSLGTSSFSVDSSANAFRFGTGATSNALLQFYGSDGDTGDFSYQTDDTFHFAGGFLQLDGPNVLPGTIGGVVSSQKIVTSISGTSGGNLQQIRNEGLLSQLDYTANEGVGTTANVTTGVFGLLNISGGTTVLTTGSGLVGNVMNTSDNPALIEAGGFVSGVYGQGTQSAAPGSVISDVRGVTGEIASKSATITNGYALYGNVKPGSGTITTSYGLFALNTNSGATRYGVFGQASGGGTNNFSGYFTGSRVQIDSDITPDGPAIATGTGELYVSGDIENRGSMLIGDSLGVDTFSINSAATNETIGQFIGDKLTGGTGLRVSHANDPAAGVDYSGSLMLVDQQDSGAASAGSALKINQQGAGNAIGLSIVQNTTSAHVANITGNNALVIDILENESPDNAVVLRSDADNNGSGNNTRFRITSQGDTYMDGNMQSASTSVGGADYAEFFETTDASLDGKMLVCQGAAENSVKHCEAGNTGVMGVVSTNPGFMGNVLTEDYHDMFADPNYRLVGMVGQIDTLVTAGAGAIVIGDPITTSSTVAGYGAKAHGPVRILGYALEALSSGAGTIRVLVTPQWFGGDVLTATGSATQVAGSFAIAASTAATVSSTVVDSGMLSLNGSAWSSGSAQAIGMYMKTVVSAVDDYKLSVTNNAGTEVASINHNGDLAISGKLYPSDRGAVQQDKYIYYDGSSGSGGDFMRTNAAGWSTGSYDFAEMFPSPDALTAGEVVMFGDASQQVKRTTGETYNRKIAGIVSTRPGFLAGENIAGNYPIALAGRVPTLVSTENGAINIGDPLTTSTHPGYAMKATEAGPILGYAADSFSGTMGTVVVYVNVSYYSGAPVAQGPAAENSISQLALDIQHFDTTGTLNFNGGRLLAVGSMTSANGTWKLESDGDLVTSGRLIELVRSATGVDVETYAATTRQMTVQLSGSVVLDHGHANVKFADIDPSFVSVIDTSPTYRALVTPYGATGALYVTNRTIDGFTITESGAASTGVSVDWLVIASRRDYAPIPATVSPIVAADPIVPAPSVDSVPATSPSVEASSDPVVIAPDVSSTDVPIVDAAISNDAAASDPSINVSPDPVPSNSVSDTVETSSGADTSVTP